MSVFTPLQKASSRSSGVSPVVIFCTYETFITEGDEFWIRIMGNDVSLHLFTGIYFGMRKKVKPEEGPPAYPPPPPVAP